MPPQLQTEELNIFVAFRPYLQEFLEEAVKTFEIVLFTASEVSLNNFVPFINNLIELFLILISSSVTLRRQLYQSI